ncbi:hypothetical protein G5V59_14380 [Nocardioides sp. W3-2-3]|uniref:DUF5667 domain-containing protein n=1 Tax=Nocardioides convexus TaxID=2712224 RepID=UPI0024184292|nr:DUF5667 domain-containing protein [Nocardioides convexus]NHA00759.1 hypothetical protein [Nocardioides convexus]
MVARGSGGVRRPARGTRERPRRARRPARAWWPRCAPPRRSRPAPSSSPPCAPSLVAAAERAPAAAEADLALRLTPRQRRGSRERRIAALVGGFAVVAASGSMAMASQDALPGDALYPVKRAIEDAQTNLKSDGASKADTVLSHASARLDEVQRLTDKGADADVIASTLQDFTDQTEQASELALDDYTATGKTQPISALRDFAGKSMDVLAGLGTEIPDAIRAPLITATQTVRQVDAAAWEACPTCSNDEVTRLPDFAAMAQVQKILGGPVLDQAAATTPPKARSATTKPGAKPSTSTTAPDPADQPTAKNPVDTATRDVGDVVDKVTSLLPTKKPSSGTTTTPPKGAVPEPDRRRGRPARQPRRPAQVATATRPLRPGSGHLKTDSRCISRL